MIQNEYCYISYIVIEYIFIINLFWNINANTIYYKLDQS